MATVPAPGIVPSGVRRLPFQSSYGLLGVIVAILAVWYVGAFLVHLSDEPFPDAKLPYPHFVVQEFVDNLDMVMSAARVTLTMAVLGFLAGAVIAIGIGVFISQSSWLEAAFMPYLLMAQMIPVIALVPVMQTVFRNPTLTRLLIAGFVTILPVAVSTVRGLKAAPPEARELMESYDASRLQTLRHLLSPSALPLVFTGLRIAAPLSVLGSVLVDLTGGQQGLGYLVLAAQVYGPNFAGLVWVAMVVLAVLGALMAQAVSITERLVAPWDVAVRGEVA
ncbi:ABC transporter permease [Nocardioides endophyticus]|uniref:ABC transporter permease n=1 Tax=Nocardioides endophyticus TaxID=1353775 RepID=A0ABP8YXP4_9ACTN